MALGTARASRAMAWFPLVFAFPQELVLDIQTEKADVASSLPREFLEFAGASYFSATTPGSGREIWSTDGVSTAILADLFPGPWSSSPELFTPLDAGAFAFFAEGPGTGRELWRSDGTAAGTELVVDIYPGKQGALEDWPVPGAPDLAIASLGGRVYFPATDGMSGVELWRSDGTPAGTELFLELSPGWFSSAFHELTANETRLFFVAEPLSTPGHEWLWASDGSVAGTLFLPPFDSAAEHSQLTPVRDRLYYEAFEPGSGRELWVTDGTVGGSVPVTDDLNPGPNSSDVTLLGGVDGELWFSVGAGPETGLWRTDGTPGGTVHVSLFPHSVASVQAGFSPVASTSGGTVFLSLDATGINAAIFATDGTQVGTHQIQGLSGVGWSGFVTAGGLAYFMSPQPDPVLWVTDGTTAQAVVDSWPTGVAVALERAGSLGNDLLLSASAADIGFEAWITDGASLDLLADVAQEPETKSARVESLARVGDRILFTAVDDVSGRELWSTDGTAAGTEVIDINPGPGYSNAGPQLVVGERAYFSAHHPDYGYEAWSSDGTAAGTQLLVDSTPGPATVNWLAGFEGKAYFAAGAEAQDLYVSDGTPAGTMLLMSDVQARHAAELQGELWFGGRSATLGYELFTTDGTPAGTGVPFELAPGPEPLLPVIDLVAVGDRLFFSAQTPLFSGYDLWVTDGTQAGTQAIASFVPPGQLALTTKMRYHTPLGDDLLFVVDDPVLGRELWRSDGVTAWNVLDLSQTGTGHGVHLSPLVPFAGGVLFWGTDGTDSGVWATDGTALGTVLVATGFLNTDLVEFPEIEVAGGGAVALFQAAVLDGFEAWRTDGTPAGTGPLFDLAQGSPSSEPASFVRLGTELFFAADDAVHGRELFKLPFLDTGDWAADVTGLGCAGSNAAAPGLTVSGSAAAGDSLTLEVSDALPGAVGLLLYGIDGVPIQVGPDCELETGVPFAVIAAAVAGGAGDASLALDIPVSAFWSGVEITLQWIFADPGGAFGGVASVTPGLEVVIGP